MQRIHSCSERHCQETTINRRLSYRERLNIFWVRLSVLSSHHLTLESHHDFLCFHSLLSARLFASLLRMRNLPHQASDNAPRNAAWKMLFIYDEIFPIFSHFSIASSWSDCVTIDESLFLCLNKFPKMLHLIYMNVVYSGWKRRRLLFFIYDWNRI